MIYGQLAVGLTYKHFELMFGINHDKGPLLYKKFKIRPIHVSTTALLIVKIRPIDASLYNNFFFFISP